jgi:Ethanolamine utilization protein EutJ (predicted chaperonin)
MSHHTARYLVGIDLGTTHTVVAYSDTQNGIDTQALSIFEIDQLVGPGEIGKRPVLPSFRYHPMAGEFLPADLQLPWRVTPFEGELEQVIIGHWARELGSRSEGRQVVSAKSWLSHPRVDRNAAILPWTAGDGVARVSPVVASASYLHHIRQAWNHAHPHHPLQEQQLVVTVPASFDEAARNLTVEAARRAGLPKLVLLEEPQAVVYDWYFRHQGQAQELLQNLPLIMVVDIGGGTTDLSLIAVNFGPDLTLTRIGVGDHLMLGGDNIDFALAHQIEQQRGHHQTKLRAATLSTLIQQTRKVKEQLLTQDAPESANVTLLGSGSRLIAGASRVTLERVQVQSLTLGGFFPDVALTDTPLLRSSAVVEFGLPYVADPAITKHLAQFILRHQSACREAVGARPEQQAAVVPTALLFNGGVFNSDLIGHQLLTQFSSWAGQSITALDNPHPDLAVAYGALAYAMARRGAAIKIGGGSARAYLLKIEDKKGEQGVCLLPKGRDEGDEVRLEQNFLLTLGEPVRFNLLSTTDAIEGTHTPGARIELAHPSLIELPPLIITLPSDRDQQELSANQKDRVGVTLACQLTEVGTLSIECVSMAPEHSVHYQKRWQLEFEVRNASNGPEEVSLASNQLPQAAAHIEQLFGSSQKTPDLNDVKALRSRLEQCLGPRDSWEPAVMRELATHFINDRKRRRRSQLHEQNWLRLCGFCMRPGFGFPADEWRVEQLWPLYSQSIQFKSPASWGDWWTFWRRIAGGLSQAQQVVIYKDTAKYINPSALRDTKLTKEISERNYSDLVRLVASLEKLSVKTKTQTVEWLLKRCQKPQHAQAQWWAIGRIATRMPFSGSPHNLIGPAQVQYWLSQLLLLDWQKQPEVELAAVMMSLKSGDRTRDIDEPTRAAIIEKLKQSKSPPSWINLVSEVKTLDEAQVKRCFGDALPSGLHLVS